MRRRKRGSFGQAIVRHKVPEFQLSSTEYVRIMFSNCQGDSSDKAGLRIKSAVTGAIGVRLVHRHCPAPPRFYRRVIPFHQCWNVAKVI
jgi:hypothetical protein